MFNSRSSFSREGVSKITRSIRRRCPVHSRCLRFRILRLNKLEPGVLISSFSRYVLYPNLIPQGNYRSGCMRKNDYLRNLAPPVGLVEVEAIALDDDCLRVRDEVTLNDLSLTGTGAPSAVHKNQLTLVCWHPRRRLGPSGVQ